VYRVLEATVAYATLISTFYYYYYYYYYYHKSTQKNSSKYSSQIVVHLLVQVLKTNKTAYDVNIVCNVRLVSLKPIIIWRQKRMQNLHLQRT